MRTLSVLLVIFAMALTGCGEEPKHIEHPTGGCDVVPATSYVGDVRMLELRSTDEEEDGCSQNDASVVLNTYLTQHPGELRQIITYHGEPDNVVAALVTESAPKPDPALGGYAPH